MAIQKPVLALNVGSSSIKYAVWCDDEEAMFAGEYDRLAPADYTATHAKLFEEVQAKLEGESLGAIGHRVVHGGSVYTKPVVITDEVIAKLRELIPFAPNHLPGSIASIECARTAYADIPQVACFDTAFHATMPSVAQRFAIPRELHDQGIRRYGFHGLSYQSIMRELACFDPKSLHQRVVVAHLGSGASLCAIVNGKSVDTTMGLAPNSGIVMGTRCGDIEPEVPLWLCEQAGRTPASVRDMLNHESGLLGISGISADVRDLLKVESANPAAAEALASFCYSVRKGIAAMAAAAGGCDLLVFTGGIGAHSAVLRARIMAELEFLGMQLNEQANASHSAVISGDGSRVVVCVIKTDEEATIAQSVIEIMKLEA